MRTIIKLAIAAAMINAAFRCGLAYARYYELKDAAQQMVTFGAQRPPDEIRGQILVKARELSLVLSTENVVVHREGALTVAEAAYIQEIEVFPNYLYPLTFRFNVDALSAGGLR